MRLATLVTAQTTPPQSKAQTANSSTPPFMTPNATTPVKTPKSKRQQQQQLPPNLVELISSLEEEFEEMNDKYVSLLSRYEFMNTISTRITLLGAFYTNTSLRSSAC